MRRTAHIGALAAALALVTTAAADDFTATTEATAWSGISEWSPSAFVSDAANTATVAANGSSFAFDTAVTAEWVKLVAGADLTVTMPTTPSAAIFLDGTDHLVTFASSLPGKTVNCSGAVKITSRYQTSGLTLNILDGTTTFASTDSNQVHVENKWITINVKGGLLQNSGSVYIYTGYTGGAHQYYNVCGGKMTCKLQIANYKAQGVHVNVTAGEFAPTALISGDWEGYDAYYRDCIPISISGGTFSVPAVLWRLAPVTATGTDGGIRSDLAGGSVVHSQITIPADTSLSLVEGQGGLTILRDIAGAGTLVAAGGNLRPQNTNRVEGVIRFVSGKTLVIDTSYLTSDTGAIIAEGGFEFPTGKSIADLREFVTLTDPYGYAFADGGDGKTILILRQESTDYVVSTESATWSGIADAEWSPHAFYSDKESTVTITTSASTFALDGAVTAGAIRLKTTAAALTAVTVPAAITCDHVIVDGTDNPVKLASLPRNLECDGTVEISTGSPASSASSLKVIGGTTTLTASRVNVENCTFAMTVTGGVLTTKSGDIYTGHQGGAVRRYNVSGGKFSGLLTVPNQNAYLRNYISVSGGEFAPKGIRYSSGSEAGDELVGNIFDFRMTGGRFSAPAVLPRWAPLSVEADAELRAQSAAVIRPEVAIADGATLSLAENCGTLTFCRDFTGTGTLAVDHDATWRLLGTNRLAGAVKFATGATLTIDSANLAGDAGAIIPALGFLFPDGKSAADIAEFVALANPNAYRFYLSADGKALNVCKLGAIDYAAHTAATAWSAMPDADWTPTAFISDADSSADVFAQGGAFAFDTTITCKALRFVTEGGQSCDLTFPKTPTMSSLLVYGSNGTVRVTSAFPSGVPMRFLGDVSVNVYQPGSSGCTRMDVLGGTTTLVGANSMIHIENISFTMNLYDGLLQNASGVGIYTGFLGYNHQYFNVYGGKMTSAFWVANANSRGSHVNVYAGELAPTAFSLRGTPTSSSGTALPIRLMGGTFSVPSELPAWTGVEVVSNATMRPQAGAVVRATIAVDADRTLTLAPSVSGGTFTFMADITGSGAVQAQDDVTFRLVSTNTISAPFAMGADTKLTIDTSEFGVEEGVLAFAGGLTPPVGKTMADVADFVKLSNPYGYEYELLSDGRTFVVRSRGAITYVADTAAAAWSAIPDEDWSPFVFLSDVKNLITVRTRGSSFAFDTSFVGDTLRVASECAGCTVSFSAKPTVNTVTYDGSNALLKISGAFPGISPARLCGDVEVAAYQPASGGCNTLEILDGTTTLDGNGTIVHVENIYFVVNVRDGLLQNKSGVGIYTGFTGGSHQYFNVYGGKMTSRLCIANYQSRGSHVNVYGGEFAPTALNYKDAVTSWHLLYNGAALPIRLMGGTFSAPSVVPKWAEVTAVSNATLRAQGATTVYSKTTLAADATLTVAASVSAGGSVAFAGGVTGDGSLEIASAAELPSATVLGGRLVLDAGATLTFAVTESDATNALVTAAGGIVFRGCSAADLGRLVRLKGLKRTFFPVLRGRSIGMSDVGTLLFVR